jgi:hypothetical protein
VRIDRPAQFTKLSTPCRAPNVRVGVIKHYRYKDSDFPKDDVKPLKQAALKAARVAKATRTRQEAADKRKAVADRKRKASAGKKKAAKKQKLELELELEPEQELESSPLASKPDADAATLQLDGETGDQGTPFALSASPSGGMRDQLKSSMEKNRVLARRLANALQQQQRDQQTKASDLDLTPPPQPQWGPTHYQAASTSADQRHQQMMSVLLASQSQAASSNQQMLGMLASTHSQSMTERALSHSQAMDHARLAQQGALLAMLGKSNAN